jgi:Mn-containing catalase
MFGIPGPGYDRAAPGIIPDNRMGKPWNGDYVFSSSDLVEDLTHNFFL